MAKTQDHDCVSLHTRSATIPWRSGFLCAWDPLPHDRLVASAHRLSRRRPRLGRHGGCGILRIGLAGRAAHGASRAPDPAEAGVSRGNYDFGLLAGPVWSTEFAAAAALSALALSSQEGGPHGGAGPRLAPLPGDPGGDNVADVLSSPSADLAMISLPALSRAAAERPGLRDRLALVAPLYPAEVHVIARRGIAKLDDLRGHRVAVPAAGGGRNLFERLGIDVDIVERVEAAGIDPDALGVDALVVVSGQPVASLARLRGWHLLPVPYAPALQDDFLPARIAHATYPDLVDGDEVDTVAMPIVLVAYRWPKRWERTQILGTVVVGMIEAARAARPDAAVPKLADINWAARLPGWQRLEPVERWLATNRPESTGSTSMRKDSK